jgi:acetyltransferase
VPELLNTVKAFAFPPMLGDNLAVISRSGGHAVITADRAILRNFKLVNFSDKTMDKIEKISPTTRIIRQNPLDVGDVFDTEIYVSLLEAVLSDSGVDGVAFMHVYSALNEAERSRELLIKLIEVSKKYPKPVALSFVARAHQIRALKDELRYPIFFQPEDAIDGLAALRDWHKRKIKPFQGTTG